MCQSRCWLKYTFSLLLNIIYLRFNLLRAKRSCRTDIGKILRHVVRGGCQNWSDQQFDIEINVLLLLWRTGLYHTLCRPFVFHNLSLHVGDVFLEPISPQVTDLSSFKNDAFLYVIYLLQDSDHSLVYCSPCS